MDGLKIVTNRAREGQSNSSTSVEIISRFDKMSVHVVMPY